MTSQTARPLEAMPGSARSPGLPPVRAALMGCGRWGTNMARVLADLPQFDLVVVADPEPSARARAGRIAPTALATGSIEDFIGSVEAVIVCTPTESHAAHGEYLLSRGLHVLLEKPMALDVETADRLLRRSRDHGRLLAVGHQTLRHGCWERLVEIVAAGRIGAPRRIRAMRSGLCNLEQERGVLWSLGPHDVAMVLALLGRFPEAIGGELLSCDERGWPAAARLRLDFTGGPEGELVLDGRTDRRERLFQVIGDGGRVSFDDAVPGGRVRLATPEGEEEELRVRAQEPLIRECLGFWKAIRSGDTAEITEARHGADVTKVLATAQHQMGIDPDGCCRLRPRACR